MNKGINLRKRKKETIDHYEDKNYKLIKCANCPNIRMQLSQVCSDCYEKISYEMSLTVKRGDCLPIKFDEREDYNELPEDID